MNGDKRHQLRGTSIDDLRQAYNNTTQPGDIEKQKKRNEQQLRAAEMILNYKGNQGTNGP